MIEELEKLIETFKKKRKEYKNNPNALRYINKKIKEYEDVINVVKDNKKIKKKFNEN